MRLIDADALAQEVRFSQQDNPHKEERIKANHYQEHNHFLNLIVKAQSVDARPVVHGKWIISEFGYNGNKYWRFDCSECGATNTCRYEDSKFDYWSNRSYCPICGAKMDGEKIWHSVKSI